MLNGMKIFIDKKMRDDREFIGQTIQDPQEAMTYLKISLDEYEHDC
jgi:hypothetical protein